MQFHQALSYLATVVSIHAALLPLDAHQIPAAAASFNQSYTNSSLSFTNTSLYQTADSDLYDRIATGIKACEEYKAKWYHSLELYKILLSSPKLTTEIDALSYNIAMHFKVTSKEHGRVERHLWYYSHKYNRWGSTSTINGWSEGEDFEALSPIDIRNGRPIDLRQAIHDIEWSPDPKIPKSQSHGPWHEIDIVKYKKTPGGFWNELILRFRKEDRDEGGPIYAFVQDVLVGTRSGTAVVAPAEFCFGFRKNPWGWGQDNRFSPDIIGPMKYSDYLNTGVSLVIKTMGNGYYKNAQLIQIKFTNPEIRGHPLEVPASEVRPAQYFQISLFFRWQNRRGETILLRYDNDWWSSGAKSYTMDVAGNKWPPWSSFPIEIPWSKSSTELEYLSDKDPGERLDTMKIINLRMSILSAFNVWRREYDRGFKNWKIKPYLYLCKPKGEIDSNLKDKMVYYFPDHILLGTRSGKAVIVDYTTIISNSTQPSYLTDSESLGLGADSA